MNRRDLLKLTISLRGSRAFNLKEKSMSTPIIRSFEKPMWQSPFFSHSSQYGIDTNFANVGNAIWIAYSESESIMQYGYPMIVGVDPTIPFEKHQILNQTIAWWLFGGTVDELTNKVSLIEELYPEKPIIAYLDGDNWTINNPFINFPSKIWPSIQTYRFPNEPLGSFKRRMIEVIDKVSGYNLPMFLNSRFDDFNGNSTIDNIVECMPFYEDRLRNDNFIGHMPFSDRRGNAISSNQILQDWARAFLYAIPSGRPNRFDYWRPSDSDIKSILENKLGQSRAAIVLEPYLREDILSKYETPTQEWPTSFPTLEKVRNEHGALIDVDECVTILNKTAWIHKEDGWGLLRKEGGNHGAQRETNIPCSVDWLVNKNLMKGTDCLINTPSSTEGPSLGPANTTWPPDGESFTDLNNWVEPVNPEV